MDAAWADIRAEDARDTASSPEGAWPSAGSAFPLPGDGSALRRAGDGNGDRSASGPGPEASSAVPLLGTLLVRAGLVDEEELEQALAEQRASSGKRLGEVLVERGTLTRAQVARAVAEQYELPFVDLAEIELDNRVCALLPADIARRYSALPLDFLPDGSLRLVVADPTKVLEPDEILAALGARLSFAVADPDLVEAAIVEHEAAERPDLAWAAGPIGPPVSGLESRPLVDASDLIIVPADELPSEESPLERREAPPGAATEEVAAATGEETSESRTEKRRRGFRFWRRRRAADDRDEGLAKAEAELAAGEVADPSRDGADDAPRDVSGAAEDGSDVDEVGDPQATSALRLWLASVEDRTELHAAAGEEERGGTEAPTTIVGADDGAGLAVGEATSSAMSAPDPGMLDPREDVVIASLETSAAASPTSSPEEPERPWSIFAPTPLPTQLEPSSNDALPGGDDAAASTQAVASAPEEDEPEPSLSGAGDRSAPWLVVVPEPTRDDELLAGIALDDGPVEVTADAESAIADPAAPAAASWPLSEESAAAREDGEA
ncbi:MAG: hypothetical protein NZL88_08620, partial [Gaiellaceae bacterium]|nr:hypothetical protein [Gaiellaceae bacterium]